MEITIYIVAVTEVSGQTKSNFMCSQNRISTLVTSIHCGLRSNHCDLLVFVCLTHHTTNCGLYTKHKKLFRLEETLCVPFLVHNRINIE